MGKMGQRFPSRLKIPPKTNASWNGCVNMTGVSDMKPYIFIPTGITGVFLAFYLIFIFVLGTYEGLNPFNWDIDYRAVYVVVSIIISVFGTLAYIDLRKYK